MATGTDLSFIITSEKALDLYDLSGDGSKFFFTYNGNYGAGETDFSCNMWPSTYSQYKIEAIKRETDSLTGSSFSYVTTIPDVSFVMSVASGGGSLHACTKFNVNQGDKSVSCLPAGQAGTHVLNNMMFYNLYDNAGGWYQKMEVDKVMPEGYHIFYLWDNDINLDGNSPSNAAITWDQTKVDTLNRGTNTFDIRWTARGSLANGWNADTYTVPNTGVVYRLAGMTNSVTAALRNIYVRTIKTGITNTGTFSNLGITIGLGDWTPSANGLTSSVNHLVMFRLNENIQSRSDWRISRSGTETILARYSQNYCNFLDTLPSGTNVKSNWTLTHSDLNKRIGVVMGMTGPVFNATEFPGTSGHICIAEWRMNGAVDQTNNSTSSGTIVVDHVYTQIRYYDGSSWNKTPIKYQTKYSQGRLGYDKMTIGTPDGYDKSSQGSVSIMANMITDHRWQMGTLREKTYNFLTKRYLDNEMSTSILSWS